MATVPIAVPGVGESITEGILSKWLKPDGAAVKAGEPLFELETDKASTAVPAEADGGLAIKVTEGETGQIRAEVGSLAPNANPAAVKPEPVAASAPAAKAAPSEARPDGS